MQPVVPDRIQDLKQLVREMYSLKLPTQSSAPSCFRSHLVITPMTRISLFGMLLIIWNTS
jgi:hypothetical protein